MSATVTGPTIRRGKSSGDIWTPWEFIRAVEKKFGPLAVDFAASGPVSAKAPVWLTPKQDAFTYNWANLLACAGDGLGLGWLNCEYGDIAPWAKKCAMEAERGWKGFLLVPGSIGANWYWNFVEPFADVWSVGRMVFDNCFNKDGKPITTPYPKDLILCHYHERYARPQRMRRWRWNQ